jgi:hypothetical protein
MFIVGDELIKKQENKGRDIFLTCNPSMKWIESQSKFDVWDMYGLSDKSKMYVEIKNREIKSTSYLTSFLELKKFKNLTEMVSNSSEKTKVFYFVSYTDNVSYLFNLTKLKLDELKVEKRWMKEVTLDNRQEYIQKEVIELPLTAASKKYTITYTYN